MACAAEDIINLNVMQGDKFFLAKINEKQVFTSFKTGINYLNSRMK